LGKAAQGAAVHDAGAWVGRGVESYGCASNRGLIKESTFMFTHVVIFWINTEDPQAVDKLIAGAEKYLRPIPGIVNFQVGRMAPSSRPVVDQSYQVGLSVVFTDKKAQDDYQVHPLHVEFVEKVFKPVMKKVVVYDFE
jgi:hypothetical protein